MCGCNRNIGTPRQVRSSGNVVVRNSSTGTIFVPRSNVVTSIQSLDPERLRIEQLRREAIRRSFGNTT